MVQGKKKSGVYVIEKPRGTEHFDMKPFSLNSVIMVGGRGGKQNSMREFFSTS